MSILPQARMSSQQQSPFYSTTTTNPEQEEQRQSNGQPSNVSMNTMNTSAAAKANTYQNSGAMLRQPNPSAILGNRSSAKQNTPSSQIDGQQIKEQQNSVASNSQNSQQSSAKGVSIDLNNSKNSGVGETSFSRNDEPISVVQSNSSTKGSSPISSFSSSFGQNAPKSKTKGITTQKLTSSPAFVSPPTSNRFNDENNSSGDESDDAAYVDIGSSNGQNGNNVSFAPSKINVTESASSPFNHAGSRTASDLVAGSRVGFSNTGGVASSEKKSLNTSTSGTTKPTTSQFQPFTKSQFRETTLSRPPTQPELFSNGSEKPNFSSQVGGGGVENLTNLTMSRVRNEGGNNNQNVSSALPSKKSTFISTGPAASKAQSLIFGSNPSSSLFETKSEKERKKWIHLLLWVAIFGVIIVGVLYVLFGSFWSNSSTASEKHKGSFTNANKTTRPSMNNDSFLNNISNSVIPTLLGDSSSAFFANDPIQETSVYMNDGYDRADYTGNWSSTEPGSASSIIPSSWI